MPRTNKAEAFPQPRYERVSAENIEFDPNNPRFGGFAVGLNQDEIRRLLESRDHAALQLVDSFLENGFIDYEPLVVRRVNSKYRVIEGNRRLAAVKHILDNTAGSYTPQQIERVKQVPVIIFHEARDESQGRDISVYLGVHHLFGFRQWPPESKAKFLDLHIKSEDDLLSFMKGLNIPKSEIRRYLVPYRLKKMMGAPLLKQIGKQDFWILGESISRTGIKEYFSLQVNPKTLEVIDFDAGKLRHLVRFIYRTSKGDRRITDTRQIQDLAKALASRRAQEALEGGKSLQESLLFVETTEESIKRLASLLRQIRLLIGKISPGISKMSEFKTIKIHLKPIEVAVRQLARDAKSRL